MTDTTPHQTPPEPVDILLVEDNPGDVRLIREALRTTNHEASLNVVMDGDDAIFSLAQQAKDATLPDLVLLDLNLPGRDGFEVLQAIRDDPRLEQLPVIILTSSQAEEDVARCYDAHANAYLTKPSSPDRLFALIETVERFWFEQARLPPVSA